MLRFLLFGASLLFRYSLPFCWLNAWWMSILRTSCVCLFLFQLPLSGSVFVLFLFETFRWNWLVVVSLHTRALKAKLDFPYRSFAPRKWVFCDCEALWLFDWIFRALNFLHVINTTNTRSQLINELSFRREKVTNAVKLAINEREKQKKRIAARSQTLFALQSFIDKWGRELCCMEFCLLTRGLGAFSMPALRVMEKKMEKENNKKDRKKENKSRSSGEEISCGTLRQSRCNGIESITSLVWPRKRSLNLKQNVIPIGKWAALSAALRTNFRRFVQLESMQIIAASEMRIYFVLRHPYHNN